MDPISLIVGALVAGVSTGLSDSSSDAVKSAYGRLKERLTRRTAQIPGAAETLRELEQQPAADRAPMIELVTRSGAAHDQEILAAAHELLAAAGPQAAGRYVVQVSGDVNGMAQGDQQTVHMHFGKP